MANASFILIFLFAFPIFASSQNNPYVLPTGYHLDISVPDLATSNTFIGSIEVNLTLTNSTKELVLDAENLIVDPSTVTVMRLRQGLPETWVMDNRYIGVDQQGPLLKISFTTLSKANYRVQLNYTGHLQMGGSQGFFKSPYLYNGHETRYIGVTNLQATNARLVFPCFANMSQRTNFVLDITVNKSLVVLSNVKHTNVHNVSESTKKFYFSSYPSMPVSQLGWAVLELSTYVQHTADTLQNTIVHTRAPHSYDDYTSWANSHTALLVAAFSNYTQQIYPLQKIEQIVVANLPINTIEGWGFLSYEKESLLMSPRESSTWDRHSVLLGLSRGMAGQWFHGITSMGSKKHEWFSLGMKEYLKYTVAAMLPEIADWELQDHLVVEMVQTALALDSGDETLAASSSTTAYKGGSIIRMLHSVVGDEVFRPSLALYFQESAFKESKPADFFDKLEVMRTDLEINVDLAGQTETQIMDSWISATELPVVNVTMNGSHYIISQSPESEVFVPVTYMLQDNSTVVRTWLQPGAAVVVEGASSSKWILVNVNQTGLYRVSYDANLWALLSRQLMSDLSRIPRLNRAQLLDDMFRITLKDMLPPDLMMNLTLYLVAEVDYFPWLSAIRNYALVLNTHFNQTSYDLLQTHMLKLLHNVIGQVGLEPRSQDSHTEKLRQALILETACALGHKGCIQKAVNILNSWMSKTYYDPDLNMALLCAGVSNSSSNVWYELWSAFNMTVNPSVRTNLLRALSCSTNTTLLNGFLNNITSVRTPVLSDKNKDTFLKTLTSTPHGAEIILDWFIEVLTLKAATEYQSTSSNLTVTEPSTINQTEYTSTSIPSINPNSTLATQEPNTTITRYRREITEPVIESISEKEAITILMYGLPKLTSLEQGAKLEKFFQETKSNLANETVLLLEKAISNIYKSHTKVQKFKSQMVVWLSNALATTTTYSTTTAVSTTPNHTTSTPGTSTPNSANTSCFSSIAVILLSVVVNFRIASVSRC